MAQGAEDWRRLSVFDELDESWIDGKKSSSAQLIRPLQAHDANKTSQEMQGPEKGNIRAPSVSSDTTESSQKTASTTTAKASSTTTNDDEVPSIILEEKAYEPSPSNENDLCTINTGSNSPSLRMMHQDQNDSHDASANIEEAETQAPLPLESSTPHKESSPVMSNDEEDAKAEGRDDQIALRPIESLAQVHEEDDQYGSAREEQSISLTCTAPADVTCIEYSQVESLPDEAGPEWRKKAKEGKFAGKDLLNKPKSQLRTMFEGMYEAQEIAAAAAHEKAKAAKAISKAEDDRVGDMRTPTDIPAAEAVLSEESDNVWVDVADERRNTSAENQEKETEDLLAQVPQCTFTFSSPVVQKRDLPVVMTPSRAHGLLRLLPAGAEKAEIEQILNTPRSERKSRDAIKLVSKLVEQERGERERKRVRVDHRPGRSSLPAIASRLNRTDEQDQLPHTRDYVGEASEFIRRLKAASSSSSLNPRVSSLIINRRGAKAPTPESSILRSRSSKPFLKGPSPRKILRLWSAADQVDEEIEEERRRDREAEREATAADEWLDIPEYQEKEASQVSKGHQAAVPIVSIDPPTQRGLEDIVSGAKGTAQRGMLHIGPEDVNLLEMEKMAKGRMTFDRAVGKWIPARIKKHLSTEGDQMENEGEDSGDPFQDIESLVSKSSISKVAHTHVPRSQSALRNEVHLGDISATSTNLSSPPLAYSEGDSHSKLLSAPKTPQPPVSNLHSPTPRSILKTGRSAMLTMNSRSPTTRRPEGRSISFADNSGHPVSQQRVEKVEDLLRQLAELALGPDDSSVDDLSARRQDTPTRKLNFTPPSATKPGARSPWGLSLLRSRGEDHFGNASFLTNASFNMARERILELITDVAPWEPGWQDLKQIDLSDRRVDTLVRLKEFLPALEEANLDDNEIAYLTGLPNTLRFLSLRNNRLPPTVSFGHLMNLESLDISFNHIDDSLMSLCQLAQLRHLRAESNHVTSVEGIVNLSKLETLNLRGNNLQAINIVAHQWPCLKDLIVSHNQIVTIRGLSHLKTLRSLNLDHNDLSRLDLGSKMSRLRQLRLSGNRYLSSLDVGPAMNLRTLYADDCALREVLNLDCLHKLDNLSLRQQNGEGDGINWPAHQTRDIKRLFLSGNAFKRIDLTNRATLNTAQPSVTKFYSMVYLELSACQLSSLPRDLSELVPNLRHLNADYNLFESLPPLGNLHRLKRLSVIGCRISKSRRIVESLHGCDELAILDVRMNPCTMGLYPPILMSSNKPAHRQGKAFLPPIPHPDIARPDLLNNGAFERDVRMDSLEGPIQQSFFHKRHPAPDLSAVPRQETDKDNRFENATFVNSDTRFYRTLPSQFRLQRLLHRGALAMACPNLTWLDGLLIDEKEVQQADQYFQSRLYANTTGHIRRGDSSQGGSVDSSSGSTFDSLE